ncbi:MAG: DUF6768 family protein [Verrucomicrobiota bacterium]
MKENEIDDVIREAFDDEDRALLEKYADEPSLLELVAESFRGRSRWVTIHVYLSGIILFGLAIWCAIRFFNTDVESTRALIGWATGFLLFMLVTMMTKIWAWMEMQRHSLAREIKRLELEIVRLAQRGD